MSQSPFNQSTTKLVLPSRGDHVISIRISRNTLIALLVSVLLHLLLLWWFAPKLISMGSPSVETSPLEITLEKPVQEKPVPAPAEVAPVPPIEPTPPVAKPKKVKPVKTKPAPPQKPADTPVNVVKKSEEAVPKAEILNKKPPQPVPPAPPTAPMPGEDMQSYIRRQKEAKLLAQGVSSQVAAEVVAQQNPQSAGEKRDAKIKENLNFDGSNGIFEIRSLNTHSAQFSFKGWKNNINTARLEIIDVQAPDGEDIKRAVIQKMIEIIRRDYNGDFNWDSHRLGRVLVLSARPQDNEALEAFMMREFFGDGTPFH